MTQPGPLPTGLDPFKKGYWLNFARLGDQYLEAAKILDKTWESEPKWPTYQNAFHALELYIKAFLLIKNVSVGDLKKIGHRLSDALSRAKAEGLVLKVHPTVESGVMKVSEYYTSTEFRYDLYGTWAMEPTHLVINFVDQVRRDARL